MSIFLTESFERAKIYCQKFRAQCPAHYNVRRQFDQPVPSLNPIALQTAESVQPNTQTDDEQEHDETVGRDDNEQSIVGIESQTVDMVQPDQTNDGHDQEQEEVVARDLDIEQSQNEFSENEQIGNNNGY